VKVSGTPDTVCGGIAKPTVGTFFCVAPVSASAVNAAGGLPALGRVGFRVSSSSSPELVTP
jgi:hypothetical protein